MEVSDSGLRLKQSRSCFNQVHLQLFVTKELKSSTSAICRRTLVDDPHQTWTHSSTSAICRRTLADDPHQTWTHSSTSAICRRTLADDPHPDDRRQVQRLNTLEKSSRSVHIEAEKLQEDWRQEDIRRRLACCPEEPDCRWDPDLAETRAI